MSRKHYAMIAATVKVNLEFAKGSEARLAIQRLAWDLAGEFKRDNSAFKFDRFYVACGLDSNGEFLPENFVW